jgi:NADH:ubiquinone oxidoreductase subunit F (NADH-binding)
VNGWPFDLYVTHGAGAYICVEETEDRGWFLVGSR